jgi:hypothetical protein
MRGPILNKNVFLPACIPRCYVHMHLGESHYACVLLLKCVKVIGVNGLVSALVTFA